MKQEKNVGDNYKDLHKYFLDNFPLELLLGKNKPQNKEEAFIMDVYDGINDIQSIFERISRYPVYFEKFYPDNTLISEAEVIEYHLHSYIQEIYCLHEKIIRLLNIIRKNAELFNIANVEDVEKIFTHLKEQVEKGLVDALEIRGKHVHVKSIRDLDITKAKMFKVLNDNKLIDENQFNKKYPPLIDASKQKYIEQAKKNSSELLKLMNFISCRIGHILSSYFGHDPDRFTKLF
jgi:hypothetical protein